MIFSYDLLVTLINPLKPQAKRIKSYIIFCLIVIIGYEVFDYMSVDGLDTLFYDVKPSNTELFNGDETPYQVVYGLADDYYRHDSGRWRFFLFPCMLIQIIIGFFASCKAWSSLK